ncbi:glycosyl-4,4'-diaponeurosporenoate acyltransferase CrtO family protein [Catenuloplanes sp. NPDC020197]|uniref:glycosyl-4,4'-diaponeurosporenoate acyltransferase CrtO family protein n=1 Tax=Catenuloplanes sp. NPDC020197 TaxID=3363958 RepID=UPI0037BB1ADB
MGAGLYRRLGAWSFMRLLRRIGWERAMRASRAFDGTRATLPAFDRDTRRSELAHTVLAGAGLLLAVVAAIAGAWTAVAWHAALTTVLHVYPTMLQRAMRARLARLRPAPDDVAAPPPA